MKLGIIGAGQLAQFLAHSADLLGMEVICLSHSLDVPAKNVSKIMLADYGDRIKLKEFAQSVDVVTYESENVEASILDEMAPHARIYPDKTALLVSQDRLREKQMFNELNIPTTQFFPVDSPADLARAQNKVGAQCVLKTRRFGYDGKGQWLLPQTLRWEDLASKELIVEEFIDFDFEVSLIAARSVRGERVFYSLTKNIHREGILRTSIAPFIDENLEEKARDYVDRILTKLNYVGVFALEFFVRGGELLANEMAPRVHNSGHWTMDGAVCSQFENHLRALFDLPLGRTECRGQTTMTNFIGHMPKFTDVLAIPHAHFYHYHKEPRPNRKLGHMNLVEPFKGVA